MTATTLPDVLTDPTVEIRDLRTTVAVDAFERRRRTVESGANRAAAAVVREEDGRLLLVSDAREGAYPGWRLPGTPVGDVTDFDGELAAAVEADLGIALDDVAPRWVYRQSAVLDGETAPLYYVVCEATAATGPPSGTSLDPSGDVEARWFETPPDRLVNPTVVRERFE